MKKLISVLLTLTFVFGMCVPAFAAEEKTVSYEGDPVIIVRGIDFGGLIHEDGSKALAFNLKDVLTLVYELAVGTAQKKENAFEDALLSYCQKLFAPISSDNEGKSVYPDVHMETYLHPAGEIEKLEEWTDGEGGLVHSAVEKLGGENVYFFTYDWRKSPLVLSDELNSFVEMVKKEKNASKVDMAACSMGGMVATAYMYEYGTDSVDSLVYLSSAHNGTDVAGAALTGDIYTSEAFLSNYLMNKVGDSFLLKVLIKAVDAAGVFGFVADFLNNFVTKNKDRVYDELMRDYLGTSLGFWGLCCDKDFDSSVDFVFGKHKDEYPVVMSELSKIREFLFSTEKVIDKAYADGVKVSFVSHYGDMLLPIYAETVVESDSVLESYLTSNGATFALFGETLTDEYLSESDAKYISPDKVVDASTALYKDTTWFIKDAPHVGCRVGSEHADFALWLLSRESQPTVTADSAYPCFMAVDKEMNFIR